MLARQSRGTDITRARPVLREADLGDRPVVVPSAVLAELYGTRHDGAVDALLARAGIRVVTTGRTIARVAGTLLKRDHLDTCHLADAVVVATAIRLGGGVVLTSDVDDLRSLARQHRNVEVVAV